MSVSIASYEPRHLDGVVALCSAQGWPSWTHERTARSLASPCVFAAVAEDGGNIVGAAVLLTDGELISYLGMLVVAERLRRRGVGTALIQKLFELSGRDRMDLLAEDSAGPFYESMAHKTKPGYRIYDTPS
jgi:ribosomal protein S18 acetylase RimI-like enzyme